MYQFKMYIIGNIVGYDIGCVRKRRYDQTLRMRSKIEDGIKLLNSVSQTMFKWKKSLGLKTSKNPETKTCVYIFHKPYTFKQANYEHG